jgi:hypothetical protein
MGVRLAVAILGALALSSGFAHAYQYKSARALYRDCATVLTTDPAGAPLKGKRCADYIDRIFDGWLLSQRSDVCSQLRRSDLAKGYIEYWKREGLGFVGSFRSPAASVREFLDARSEPCSARSTKPSGSE